MVTALGLNGLHDDSGYGDPQLLLAVDGLLHRGQAAVVLSPIFADVLLQWIAVAGKVGLGPAEEGDVDAVQGPGDRCKLRF